MNTISEYYRSPEVRRQILRFLGADALDEATAAFITGSDPGTFRVAPLPVRHLDLCLEQGMDVGRSLWDRKVLVAHFDIDYVNFTFPAEAHVDAQRTFGLLQPVVQAAKAVLAEWDIAALHLLSGQGHHLVWSIRRDSEAARQLSNLGRLPPSVRGRYLRRQDPPGAAVGPDLGKAHAGLGLVLEYFAHCVLARAAPRCRIPVELTACRVGAGRRGAELVSLDISEYGDPLHLRGVRVPFSVYLKPQQKKGMLGDRIVSDLPPLFLIPLNGRDVTEGLEIMRSPERVARLAGQSDVSIPDQTACSISLIDEYAHSPLARFHDWFYSKDSEPPERWPSTYDATPLGHLPPCGREVLDQPCDLLMQPGRIRHLVRLLLADGWHPRDIAGLIRSKYERDYGWGRYWLDYDATSRADFYTRLFAGLFFTGRDDLVDFNCCSAKEKGYCSFDQCTGGLEGSRRVLLQRRLAHV